MIDKKIFARYLEGKGSQGDKETIIDWFSCIREESSLRKESMPIWENPDSPSLLPEEKAEKLLDRIHHRIRLQGGPAENESGTVIRYLRVLSRVAAVLFIPLVIYMWTLRDEIFSSAGDLSYSEIICPPGTRVMFNLPDGSHGWLNGGSSLEFPHEFKGKSREVRLAGEGFFEVESNRRKPFIVSTDHIQVKAHGTSINVLSYPSDNVKEVTLVEGTVEVHGGEYASTQKLGTLEPGQTFSLDLASASYQIGKADVDKAISWKNGKLIFRDDSFKEVIKKCNRWYNVDIRIKDKELENYTYVGTFHDETLDEVLKLLVLTAPIEYKDMGRKHNEDGSFEKRMIELRYNKRKI